MKSTRSYWVWVAALAVLIAGCSSEKADWEKTKSRHTVQVYQIFLENYPNGTFSDSARSEMDTLFKERHPALRHAKRVKLTVEEFYRRGAKGVKLPFSEIAKRLLESAGLTIITSGDKDYDLMMKIKAEGTPYQSTWEPVGGGPYQYYYTNASVSGTITVEIPGLPSYEKEFAGKTKITGGDLTKYQSPSDAPFKRALWESDYTKQLLVFMRDFFGPSLVIAFLDKYQVSAAQVLAGAKDLPIERLIASMKSKNSYAHKVLGQIGKPTVEPLISALKDDDSSVRAGSALALGNIGDVRSVEPLIAALKDDDEDVRRIAAQALGKIQDISAIEPLSATLKDDRSKQVRLTAEDALRKIQETE